MLYLSSSEAAEVGRTGDGTLEGAGIVEEEFSAKTANQDFLAFCSSSSGIF